jgi:MFS family permease
MTASPALLILALWLAGLGAAAQFGKMSILYDDLMRLYGPAAGGAGGVALMVSVVGIVGLVFGTTAGLGVARLGPRRALVAALALGAAVSAAQAGLPGWPVMMASRVLEGFSHLAIVVVGPTAIAGLATARWQGLAMTLWSSFFGVTYALLALIGPPLVAGAGPSGLLLAHAGWMAAMALVLGLMLPPDPRPVAQPGQGGLLARHLAIYASPRTAAPAMGFVCYTAIYVAVLTLLPPLVPEALRPTVAVGMPLVSIAFSLSFGVLLLRVMSAVALVQAGFAVAAVAGLALWLLWGWSPGLVAAAFALSAALGIVQGASFAAIPELNRSAEDRASASGAVAQLGNLGTTTGTPLLALILSALGPAGLAVFAVPLCLAGVAVHAWQRRRRISG